MPDQADGVTLIRNTVRIEPIKTTQSTVPCGNANVSAMNTSEHAKAA
jgi:hypothetical protein